MKFLMVAMIFLSGPASAIRVIGGGGGLAEMEALSLLGKLRILMQPCRSNPQLCHLTEIERRLLDFLEANQILPTAATQLEFYNKDAPETTQMFSLASQSLYIRDGLPRPTNEIAVALFVGWLERPQTAVILQQNGFGGVERAALAQKIFALWKMERLTVEVKDGLVHSINLVANETPFEAFLFLEGPLGPAREITPLILGAVDCRGARLRAVKDITVEGDIVLAKIQWVCGTRMMEFTAVLQMGSSIQVQLINRQEKGQICLGLLKERA